MNVSLHRHHQQLTPTKGARTVKDWKGMMLHKLQPQKEPIAFRRYTLYHLRYYTPRQDIS